MTTLSMGANTPLSGQKVSLTIEVTGAAADASALQLYAGGKVRGDGDMCFFNQPAIGGGAVCLSTSGGRSIFEVDTSRIAVDVEKIVFTATLDAGNFGAASAVTVTGSQGHRLIVDTAGRSEAALILAEIYQRNGQWKLRNVSQGFNGGLAALATHFGVEVAAPQPAPKPAPAPAPKPLSLSKITLTKPGESSRISLNKTSGGIVRVSATWIDNGDDRDDNDDLDLRAGILMPDGAMHWLATSHPGSVNAPPFARHMGDVTSASVDAPGTEIIEVASDISQKAGGPVGMVFSVYSAISNGPVSIASLCPEMSIEYQGKQVNCAYKFPDGKVAKSVYTYVIGTVAFNEGDLDVKLSGATSPKHSEATPWITREGGGMKVTFDGAPVFKKGRTLAARMMGAGKKKYANI
ncbi:MAG: TerD family protein [Rhodobacteraceae bacterium]|nr:TerD family protein [Paracoccaceae bacterium]